MSAALTRSGAEEAYAGGRLLIGGRWVNGDGRAGIPVSDPTTGRHIGAVPAASQEEVDEAISCAYAAFRDWSRTSAYDRCAILRAAAADLRARRYGVAATISLELGKPYAQALAEVDNSCSIIEWNAEEASRLDGRLIAPRRPGLRQMVVSGAIGVVGGISGWNAPIQTPARKISGALAAGCTIVMKPSEAAPASALHLAEALIRAGLPQGVLSVVFGDPQMIADRFTSSPEIALLSFTGATGIGRQLAGRCAPTFKRTVLELGGHAPVIVTPGCDVDLVAKQSVAAFRNSGQVCTSPTRFIVQSGIYERFCKVFQEAAAALRVGDPFEPGTDLGPVANGARVDAIRALVEDAREKGSSVFQGKCPDPPGHWYPATLLSNPPASISALREEPFGPIAILMPYNGLDDAIAEANRLPQGLAAYAFTSSLAECERLSREIEAGTLAINHWTASFPETPFGGVKDSGVGIEGGREGLEIFRRHNFVSVQSI